MADIDEVYGMLGFGRMQRTIFVCCILIQAYITNEQMGLALVVASSACDLHIDDHRMSWLMSAVFTAQILASHYMGDKADDIGRRKLMLISGSLMILSSLLSALMPEFWSFLVMRFLVGVFVSGPAVAMQTYLSEFTKFSLRPKVLNYVSYAIGFSMIIVPCTAALIDVNILIYNDYVFSSWRLLILLNLLPGLTAFVMLYRLPESPKYYLSVNENGKALAVLEECCRINKGKDVTLASLGVNSVTQPRLRGATIKRNCVARLWYESLPLLQKPYVRNFFLTSTAVFVQFGLSFGLGVWMLRIRHLILQVEEDETICVLIKEHGDKKMKLPTCDLRFENVMDSIYHGIFVLFLFILTSFLLMCSRRRTIILLYLLSAALAGFMCNFAQYDTLILIVFLIVIVPPICSLRLTLSLLIDLVPTHLRGKAVALALIFGRAGVLCASLFIGYTLRDHCYFTFNGFALAITVATIVILLLPSESKMMDRVSN
ncbi:synaptic vesicle glycoprotein 2C-like isoform X1 [Drosophila pseudoobscura]|uniref:Synaptic vesicle glycoprotein 2C-like isoform X1 n=2 Tax=Drosophila pseudoobscura pseudoobscura TaxID=46245 RepID=B5DP79_DROPS|nr:synaptic vesicle glycoprotein 2C isoform X1 [Drosophila pseudoobscura]